jgi:Polyketide cyclase / dehydrase and lipid transport
MPRRTMQRPPSRHRVDLISHWRIRAPVQAVWAALTDPDSWPIWWPHVRHVRTVRGGTRHGIGAVRSIEWRTALGYGFTIEVEAIEAVALERLRGRASGSLTGDGMWLLDVQGEFTDVTYVWRATPAPRWLRSLMPVLAPLLRWNHQRVMKSGEAGLRSYLLRTAQPAASPHGQDVPEPALRPAAPPPVPSAPPDGSTTPGRA